MGDHARNRPELRKIKGRDVRGKLGACKNRRLVYNQPAVFGSPQRKGAGSSAGESGKRQGKKGEGRKEKEESSEFPSGYSSQDRGPVFGYPAERAAGDGRMITGGRRRIRFLFYGPRTADKSRGSPVTGLPRIPALPAATWSGGLRSATPAYRWGQGCPA